MAKHFRTVDELVQLLQSRGVITDENTRSAIERESYYAIVNGYKKPFLDKAAMTSASDDVYLEGTRFDWMYDLFLFDRELRFLTFRYLTRAEAIMRTAVAYAFSETHQEKDAYLNRANYCTAESYLVPKKFSGNKAALYGSNLADLMRRLNDKLAVNRNTRPFIKHYVTAHGTVPLWVLANDLTFGNIVHFYQLMQPTDRRQVCSIIAGVTERNSRARGTLSERKLLRAGNVLNHFRNICAHDERLYCAKMGDAGYSEMMARLLDLLPAAEFAEFTEEVSSLYVLYRKRLHNMEFADLLKEMGFPINEMRVADEARNAE